MDAYIGYGYSINPYVRNRFTSKGFNKLFEYFPSLADECDCTDIVGDDDFVDYFDGSGCHNDYTMVQIITTALNISLGVEGYFETDCEEESNDIEYIVIPPKATPWEKQSEEFNNITQKDVDDAFISIFRIVLDDEDFNDEPGEWHYTI